MGAYSPFSVSRFFLERAVQARVDLTPMKLIKLVYIAHGWNLAILDNPLIFEPIQAWQYGPVIESLYHGFKCFGNAKISSDFMEKIGQPMALQPADSSFSLLGKVWEKYSPVSALQLSALTHQPGTPWDTTWNVQGGKERKGAIIPDDLIKDFYKRKLQAQTGSGH